MAFHSFSATILNLSTQQLTLEYQHYDHGEVTKDCSPPQVIAPMSTGFCCTESVFYGVGDQVTLHYRTTTGQQLEFYLYDDGGFRHPEIACHPEYSPGQQPPSGQLLSVAHTLDASDGAHVSVNYLVYPTPGTTDQNKPYQQLPLVTSAQPIISKPLGDFDLVLAVSEEVINRQLSKLLEFNLINDQWAFQNQFGSFSATIKAPIVSITQSTLSTQSLRCQINFQAGTYTTFQQQKYDMAGWIYAFNVDYRSDSFINNNENIDSKVPNGLVGTVRESVNKVVTDSQIPDSAFTVQQLYLDMVNSEPTSKRSDCQLPLDDDAFDLFNLVIKGYFRTLHLKDHPYVLAYAMTIPEPTTVAKPLPKIYPSDLRIYPIFDPDPRRRSLNYLMMANGKKFSGFGFSIANSLLTAGQEMGLFTSYDIFNKLYLSSLVSQISMQLENQFGQLPFQLSQITSTENGNYSWSSFRQYSENKEQFAGQNPWVDHSGPSYKDYSAAYTQGFVLNLAQLTDLIDQKKCLVLNLEMPFIKSLQEGEGQGSYKGGCSTSWVATNQNNSSPFKIAVVIKPGTHGIIRADVIKAEDAKSLNIFGLQMSDGTLDSMKKWIDGTDSKFLRKFSNLEQGFELKFDATFTNSIIFPIGTVLDYRSMSFLNQTNIDQRTLPLSFLSSFTDSKSLPVGPSSDNVIILEAKYVV